MRISNTYFAGERIYFLPKYLPKICTKEGYFRLFSEYCGLFSKHCQKLHELSEIAQGICGTARKKLLSA
jgi:hypothetical protein